MEVFMTRHSGWSIVEGNTACIMYLYRNWVFSRTAEENAAQLNALADDLIENYTDCTDLFLTAEAVAETMKITDKDYDFSQHVLKDKHLFIFLFQAKHKKKESFCRCMKIAGGSMAADIYMLVPHTDHESTPQSIFLHELDHCVNFTLTGAPEVPPEDFVLVTSLVGMKPSDCDIPESFAHCFAMSLPIESDLLSADPFMMVPQNQKRLFIAYFKNKLT